MTSEGKGFDGKHRKKREVDRLWFNRQLQRAGLTVTSFGTALARQQSRSAPYDKSSMTRRLQGKIPFTAQECEAMARMFGVPLEEIVDKTGSSLTGAPTTVGTVDATDVVDFHLAVPAKDRLYRVARVSEDGWASATLTVAAAAVKPANASRGLYVAHVGDVARLVQFLGTHGRTALLSAPFDASIPIESVEIDAIDKLQRVQKITL